MNRWTVFFLVIGLYAVALGCSGGTPNPTSPTNSLKSQAAVNAEQTNLWGYYDVYIDIPSQTATAVLNRGMMFSANVTQFVNNPATNLSFHINGTPIGTGFVDVDIDVSLKHPFSGLHQYDGYDVRGIFIGNASTPLKYNTDLIYAAHNGTSDQEMYDYALTASDPGVYGNPDGYTRWFNPTEFNGSGMFSYVPGKIATPGYKGTAILNPYKYFADNLAVGDNAYDFMTKSSGHGVFSAGSTNTRNYYLRFPTPNPGVKFNYAIVANWIDTTTHPANAPEACAISASVEPDLFYISGTDKGGKLKVDFSLPRQWGSAPSTVYLESSVLANPYQLAASEMIPTGGTSAYSTYHAEVIADNITGNSNTIHNEYWIIAEYDNFDYTNPFGVPNAANTDKLAAFFRSDLYVSPTQLDQAPICSFVCLTPMPASGPSPLNVSFDASGSTDPDPGDTLSYTYDFNGDGTYGDTYTGAPSMPVYGYTATYVGNAYAKVSDQKGAWSICNVPVNVTINATKNINVTETGNAATDLAIDPNNGDLLVYYKGSGHVRRWTKASNFATNSATYNCDSDPNSTMIDATSYGFALAYQNGPYWYEPIYNLSGAKIQGSYTGIIQLGNLDIIAWPAGSGTYSQCLHLVGYTKLGDSFHYAFGVFRYPAPDYPTVTGQNGAWYNDGDPKYVGTFDPATVKGGEGDADGVSEWWIQSGACTATKWNVTMDFWTYQNVVFGTFNNPGDTDNLLYDPVDITRNNQNQYFILDHLSTGAYKMKGFTYSGTTTTPIASFMTPSDYSSGTPIHIDGSDYDDKVTLLIVNGTNSYISVF